jgi:hypothetical protein
MRLPCHGGEVVLLAVRRVHRHLVHLLLRIDSATVGSGSI